MDYGTPFNRYILIEDSANSKVGNIKKLSDLIFKNYLTQPLDYLKAKKRSSPQEPAHAGFGGLFRKLSKREKERAARQESELSTSSGHRLVSFHSLLQLFCRIIADLLAGTKN